MTDSFNYSILTDITMPRSVSIMPQTFDVSRIFDSLPKLSDFIEFKHNGQLSITHSTTDDSWFAGTGSLYNYDTRKFEHSTSDFNIINTKVIGTYLETVIHDVIKQGKTDGVLIGRVRILMLNAKSCYTLHMDPEEFRYHIPLITNNKCFFVSGDNIDRMPLIGRLYKFKTKELHTAVNASFLARLHLVFDTYTDANI